jgi:F-type H+-transporting ATPase subunit b
VVLLAVLVLLAGPALAWADEHHPGTGEPEEEPSLLSPAFDLGIWSIVIFVLLLIVLRVFAWGPILEGLQKRESQIRASIKEAEDARSSAQQMREQLQQEMNNAQDKVRALMDEARKNGEHLREQMVSDARKEIQSERERLHREAELARDQALQQIVNQTADLAVLVSTKIIPRQLSADDQRRLVDEALGDLRQAAAERQRMVASVQ